MNFLTPLALLGGLVAIPIILMYMLRLRRREVPISSTFLWQQVLQDTEANTPWQKLRRNLLLILQLLILLLMVLALARPFINVTAVSVGQVTLLLDASASMNAEEADETPRFQLAQNEALNIVDTLSDGDQMTVIRVGAVPQVLASTANKSALRDAIENATASRASSDWDAALTLAAASGANADDLDIVIIGDGGLPETVSLPGISGDVRYIPVGTQSDNVAITALATDVLPGRAPQLYAQITNYGDAAAIVSFNLYVDGEFFDTSNIDIAPQTEQPIVSSNLPEGFRTIRAELVRRDGSDFLPSDNDAYAVSEAGGRRRVLLVTQGNRFIEQVVRSQPNVDVVRTSIEAGVPEGFDLYIIDGEVPSPLPDGDLLIIHPTTEAPFFDLGAETENVDNPRLLVPDDPLTTFVDIAQTNYLKIRQVSGTDGWATPLIAVDGGPLLLAGEIDGRQVALMPFDLRESDLPLTLAWPILVNNLLEWFTPSAVVTVEDSLTVGESLVVRPPAEADTVRVTLPDADTPLDLPITRSTVVFADTRAPGLYTLDVLDGESVIATQPFAVNLFSPLESQIATVPADGLVIPGAQVNAEVEEEVGQRELWPWVALGALLILLIEWYAYHQRLRVPTVFRPVARGVPASA